MKMRQEPAQIYDRVFKRLFSLSNQAVLSLLNGLFQQRLLMDSKVACHNREFVLPDLGRGLADAMLIVEGRGSFHLEAQMGAEKAMPLRMFEYGFLFAIAMQDGGGRVCFLELPNNKYRIQIDRLEQELSRYVDENAKYADENAKYADENAKYADEIERYIDEKARLRQRILELESGSQPSNAPS